MKPLDMSPAARAARLRAQIPESTDPARLERMARELEALAPRRARGGRDGDIPYRVPTPEQIRAAYADASREPHWLDLVKAGKQGR